MGSFINDVMQFLIFFWHPFPPLSCFLLKKAYLLFSQIPAVTSFMFAPYWNTITFLAIKRVWMSNGNFKNYFHQIVKYLNFSINNLRISCEWKRDRIWFQKEMLNSLSKVQVNKIPMTLLFPNKTKGVKLTRTRANWKHFLCIVPKPTLTYIYKGGECKHSIMYKTIKILFTINKICYKPKVGHHNAQFLSLL